MNRQLAQFYTTDIFSDLLIREFKNVSPKNVLELGVGNGSLMRSAIKRWDETPKYIAADIDVRNYDKVCKELPSIQIHRADGLSLALPQNIKVQTNSIEVAICNPPYLRIENTEEYSTLFKATGLSDCCEMRYLTTDVIFLAQNLRLLKNRGELGIILPDSLITGQNFQKLRRGLLFSHCVKGIIQLPENIFSKTQASTHILLLEKNSNSSSKVPLYIANRKGECIDVIDIQSGALEERMDYRFHRWSMKLSRIKKTKTLADICLSLRRGHYTHADLRKRKHKYVHTTNLFHCSRVSFLHKCKVQNVYYAHKGDILISRVGRTAGKVALVSKGSVLYSDCIYKLSVPEKYRVDVWNALTSEKGREWFKANSKGVCAKVISKDDLLRFPIPLQAGT
jgi:tRNA1(Val) A37 N6-methylase TrmN6